MCAMQQGERGELEEMCRLLVWAWRRAGGRASEEKKEKNIFLCLLVHMHKEKGMGNGRVNEHFSMFFLPGDDCRWPGMGTL